jgi:hypothetical protein
MSDLNEDCYVVRSNKDNQIYWHKNYSSVYMNGDISAYPNRKPYYFCSLETARKVAAKYNAKVFQVFHNEVTE